MLMFIGIAAALIGFAMMSRPFKLGFALYASGMNALHKRFTSTAVGVLLSVLALEARASVPDIESAPSHVAGYIQCIQTAYASNDWRSNTVAQCRASNPAVQSLRNGDYVSLTFTTAQSHLYDQAWKRWVDFDKSLKRQVFQAGLLEMFNGAGVKTAYSFKQVSADLDTRFSELDAPPFSWYPGQKPVYKTATGLSLQQLHAAELDRFTRCLGASLNAQDAQTTTQQGVDAKAQACTRDITRLNSDATQGLYGAADFNRVTQQYWSQIAASQARVKEAERARLEQEKANSWPVKFRALAGQALVFVFLGVGLFAGYRYLKGLARLEPEVSTGPRRRTERDDDQYERPRERRAPEPSARPPDLGTFTLRHKKVCSPTTKHMCASCSWWAGERTPHPVTQDLYVKVGTIGKCTHRHPGSPHGMKKFDSGTICKDFQDMGV